MSNAFYCYNYKKKKKKKKSIGRSISQESEKE